MIAWLRKWIAAAEDQDKFWAEAHRARRERQLAYWDKRLKEACDDVTSASRMVSYYEAKLGIDPLTRIETPVDKGQI